MKVLGFSHANASALTGEAVAVAYLTYLARHPATARRHRHEARRPLRLRRAARRRWSSRLAAVLPRERHRHRAGAAGPVHLTRVRGVDGPKSRTPFEDAVATVRILGVQPPASGTTRPARARLVGGRTAGRPRCAGPPRTATPTWRPRGSAAPARWPAGTSTSARPAAGTRRAWSRGPPPLAAAGGAAHDPRRPGRRAGRAAADRAASPPGQRAAVCAFVDAHPGQGAQEHGRRPRPGGCRTSWRCCSTPPTSPPAEEPT